MLNDEDNVVKHAYNRKSELNRIDFNMLSTDSLKSQLQEGEKSTSKVQKNISDAPTFGRFALPVPIHLRQVLEEGNREFEVSHEADDGEMWIRNEGFCTLCKSLSLP